MGLLRFSRSTRDSETGRAGGATDVNVLLEMFEPRYPPDDIVIATMGSVVGTHAGPRVIGVTYHTPG